MKPLTLMLKNFGPYINEIIDFNKFDAASLFLISGKTGSGKTTIFDGMSYALFGESSGKLRQGKEMRSTFADPSEPTEVCLTFSHSEHIYEISRKPEQTLYKKRGDGTRVQAAKISLIVKDREGKELREYTKRREVDKFIEELLHLDANQFAQIVLLPQGEFRTFLIANSNDKEKVLRNLFGTQLYQELTERLKEQLKTLNKEIETTRQTISAKLDQLNWEAAKPEEATIEELLKELEKEQSRRMAQQIQAKEHLRQLEKQKQAKEQEKYALDELNNSFAKLEQLKKQKTTLELQKSEFDHLRAEIKELKWSQSHQALIEKMDEKTALVHSYQQQLADNEKEQADLSRQVQQCQQKQKEHNAQAAAIEEMNQQVSKIQFQLPLLAEKEELQLEIAKAAAVLEDVTRKKDSLKEQQRALEANYQKFKTIIDNQVTLEKQQLQLEKQQEQWLKLVELLHQQEQLNKKVQELKAQQAAVALEQTAARKQQEQLQQKVKTQKSLWAQMQISRLSLLLVDGEPCPVCGALEHPQQSKPHEFSLEEIKESEEQLNETEVLVQAQDQLLANLQAQFEQLQRLEQELIKDQKLQADKIAAQLTTIKAVVELPVAFAMEEVEAITAKLKNEIATLTQEIVKAAAAETEISAVEAELASLQATLAEQEILFSKLEQAQMNRLTKEKVLSQQLPDRTLSEITVALQQLEQQISRWKTAELEMNETLTALNEQQLVLKNSAAHLEKERQSNQAEQAALKQQLTRIIESSDFELDEAALRQRMKELITLEHKQADLAEFDKKQKQLNFQLTELEQSLANKVLPEAANLNEEIDELTTTMELAEAAYYKQQEKIQANESIQKQVQELIRAIDDKWEEVTALHQLAATVNGDNPRKTSLERYVLQTYLNGVLQVANQRLSLLTKNRYQFELNQDSGSYKNQTGLEINVYDDNAGTCRSAHTLSGGESFIAALALALSLAEVIQEQAGGVLIEALFIDEGFGSLDDEALEMAMEALETIESEGRMIGIISHVNELKARIPQQLKIKTNGNGQSKVAYQTT
ncbi:AAA family ATPase [Erwinia sp. CPCC 100877]|nr:AAA family ATPase [Erwinia sp. CPCC 100877]